MNLNDYSYDLPEELIAQYPANPRDLCKLMIIKKDAIEHDIFRNITKLFKKGDGLVLNNTKVLHSKLLGKKDSGSSAEVILLKKINSKRKVYEAKIKTKNPIIGTKILLDKGGEIVIIEKKNIDTFIVKINNNNILDDAIMPSPPYIHHVLSDKEYQTVFSKNKTISKIKGSLACPTAGLHFTRSLLKKIESIGVKIVYVTLHVSYGTFKNIDNINTYVMDPEYYEVSKETANTINSRKGRLIVCGTTTLKTLETSYKKGKIISGAGQSTLFIYPPYTFKSGVDMLITNFHLPKSTLILLTCAFGGRERILNAYDVAVRNKYKFYSLGDSMIIEK